MTLRVGRDCERLSSRSCEAPGGASRPRAHGQRPGPCSALAVCCPVYDDLPPGLRLGLGLCSKGAARSSRRFQTLGRCSSARRALRRNSGLTGRAGSGQKHNLKSAPRGAPETSGKPRPHDAGKKAGAGELAKEALPQRRTLSFRAARRHNQHPWEGSEAGAGGTKGAESVTITESSRKRPGNEIRHGTSSLA